MIVLSFWVSANEDHLVMVPTPIQDEGDSGEIYIVKVPLISGYGANFEGYIHIIASPYIALCDSRSTKVDKADLNPVSIAGISLKAALARDNIYDISIDYTKVKGDWLKDRLLLKNIIKCVYMYGEALHGSQLKARFKLVGVSSESVLHKELLRCIALRKKPIK